MSPDKQSNRGQLGIDVDRLHVAGHGTQTLDTLMAQFDAFAQNFAKENHVSPESVTLVNYLRSMCNPTDNTGK